MFNTIIRQFLLVWFIFFGIGPTLSGGKNHKSSKKYSKPTVENNRINRATPHTDERITNEDARSAADALGFWEVTKNTFDSHGRLVFTDGHIQITPDRDRHNGGFWKVYRKGQRDGTFDKELKTRLGD